MLSKIFGRKKGIKEKRSDDSARDWEYPSRIKDLAKALGVSSWTVRKFLKKKGLYRKLDRDERGVMIKKELFNRIIGLKSNPPEQIDELEYDYPVSWVAEKAGICSRTVKRWVYKKGIVDYCRYDGRGIRIPRSICALIWPKSVEKEGERE